MGFLLRKGEHPPLFHRIKFLAQVFSRCVQLCQGVLILTLISREPGALLSCCVAMLIPQSSSKGFIEKTNQLSDIWNHKKVLMVSVAKVLH